MKKIVSLIVLLAIMLIATSVFAVVNTLTLEATLSSSKVSVGDEVTVTIDWKEEMQAADYILEYDSSKVQFVSTTLENDSYSADNPGKIIVVWFNGTKSMTNMKFKFKAIANGTANFAAKVDGGFADENVESPSNYVEGSTTLTISEVVTPTKTATPTETTKPTETVTPTQKPTETTKPTETVTPTQEPTETTKPTETATPTQEPTETTKPTETATPTQEPTETAKPTETAIPTQEPTETAKPTEAVTPTQEPTETTETVTPTQESTETTKPTETVKPTATSSGKPSVIPQAGKTTNTVAIIILSIIALLGVTALIIANKNNK